jgi:serine/threonine protein kinase
MAQAGTEARSAMEMFTTTPRTTISTASQITTNTPELHNESLEPAEVADRIQELEDELWKKDQCLKRLMEGMNSQLTQFRKDIQEKNKIISELKKKLDAQKHGGIDDDMANAVTMTNKSLTMTGRVDASQFDFHRILGIGGFGTVILGQKKGGVDDGRFYAVKMLKKAAIIQKNTIDWAMTERRVLEAVLQYPFLSTFHYAFQSDSKLYLVLEYVCGGNLLAHYHGRKFADDDVRFYIGETILALEYLHKLGIMHRDVKLENILLDLHGHVVLSDFGCSKMFLPHEKHKTYSGCGTLSYMAPEVVATSAAGYGMEVDWWSLGVVTYELLAGLSPFGRRSVSQTDEEITCQIITAKPYIPDDLSFDAADFISKLLVKDPRNRLGGGKDDAEELKRHLFFEGMNWSDLAQKKILAPFSPIETNEFDDSNSSDELTKIIHDDLPATLPPNCDKLFRGYSYVSPSVLCSECVVIDELSQPTAETPPNSAGLLYCQYTCRIKSLETELSEAKRVQMSSDMEKTRLELDLSAATEKIESLEAKLSKANCVQKRYNGEKRRLQKDLRDAIKKITSLEVELNEANCQWKGYNRGKSMLEVDLIAAIKRIEPLEMELIEANDAWKRYNQENRKMETDLRAATERIQTLEAEFTKANWVQKRCNREESHLRSGREPNKILEAELTEANHVRRRCNRKKRRLKTELRCAI